MKKKTSLQKRLIKELDKAADRLFEFNQESVKEKNDDVKSITCFFVERIEMVVENLKAKESEG